MNKFEMPSIVQFAQLMMLLTYVIIAWFYLGFLRPERFYYTIIFSFFLDLLFNSHPARRTASGKIKFPVTGGVVGCALSLLLESSSLWLYFGAAVLAIASKTLIRIEKRHIFNPANFGVVSIIVLSAGRCTINTAQWSGSFWVLLLMFICGAVVAFMARRLMISISYLVSFLIFSALYSGFKGLPLLFIPGSLFGISTVLFMFHMITDPVTSPSSRKMQLLMGASIAAVDLTLRANQVMYAQIVALLITLSVYALFGSEKSTPEGQLLNAH